MCDDFGSRLDHISDDMYHMNTRIDCIAWRQSHLGNFAPLPSLEPDEDSFDGEDEGDDASVSSSDDEMTASQ